jgi:hypothetical protein
MTRRILILALVAAVATPLAAQAPKGWTVRVDRSTNASDPDDTPNLKVTTVGTGFQVTGGPAGTFWNPANATAGNFTARATFKLMKPSGHLNYYGLIFGGEDLGGANQAYIYFLVGQNGTFIVRHRAGEQVHDVQARTANASIAQPGADGSSTNTLEVRVAGDTITYSVNGTVVHKTPKSGFTAKTDGLVGVRINHQLDVTVDGFTVTKG